MSGERHDAADGAFRQTPPVCDRFDRVRTTFEQFVPPAAGISDEGGLFAIALSFQVSRSHDDRPGATVLLGRDRQVEPGEQQWTIYLLVQQGTEVDRKPAPRTAIRLS